jgi:uncharacterized protein (DUF433 family)
MIPPLAPLRGEGRRRKAIVCPTATGDRSDSKALGALCVGLSDNIEVAQPIMRDPETMHGVPVFRGTRVQVQTLFDYLEGGDTLEDFLEGYPTVSRALAVEALEEAKQLLLART